MKEDLKSLCDRYGYIFVAPMGYSVSGWYGAPMTVPGGPPPTTGNQPARPLPPPQTGTPDEQLRERELSEQDVLNVVALVKSEYKIDPDRVYLMGHSMGGFGAWYLGAKHADLWAAIAPMSGTTPSHDIDVETLSKLPVLVAVGGEEVPTVGASKAKVDLLKAAAGVTAYVEIEKGTHMSMIPPSLPQIFEFFSKHMKHERVGRATMSKSPFVVAWVLVHAGAGGDRAAAGRGRRSSSSQDLARQAQTPGAKGDQQRHYFFEDAGKEMPYRLYVPRSYDPNVGAPLIVALHGYGGNQNYFFDSRQGAAGAV